MKLLIGIAMLASYFIGMFVWIWCVDGLRSALAVYAITGLIMGWAIGVGYLLT